MPNTEYHPIDLQSVKGTRDFYPEQMKIRNWLFTIWRNTALQFGFEEYDACVLEHAELYTRKAGDEITEQLYSFHDKGGRLLSLRPEMTPSLARMVLQRQKALSFPLKWFSIPQCFRYERMTRGRRREHFQWNADIIGQPAEVAEAEIFSLLLMSCENMGLTSRDIRVFVNDRRILNAILSRINVPDQQQNQVMIVMDKRDKLPADAFAEMLQQQQMTAAQVEQLNDFLSCQSMEELAVEMGDSTGLTSLRQVMEMVAKSGFGDYLQFDVSIVRGLSYYTGTVFEMNVMDKSQRAICGGGRYDSLLSTYGGDSVPAVGFGFGDVVILDVLSDLKKLPSFDNQLEYMVIPFSSEEIGMAVSISNQLRHKGKSVECDCSLKKVKKALQRADELKVQTVVLLFPDELAVGEVVLRDMKTRQQENMTITRLIENAI
ncbi:MAG: histidine--tRNA ligase [SAR324 cluster bacterium]|nr:histidine--tRNA ligase [SAR324 cluster bacterium]